MLGAVCEVLVLIDATRNNNNTKQHQSNRRKFYSIWVLAARINKKVLLRERMRHTDRRVASTRYVASVGGGVPWVPPRPGPGGGVGGGGCPRYPLVQVQVGDGGHPWYLPVQVQGAGWGGGPRYPPIQVQVGGGVGWGVAGRGGAGYPPRDVNRQTN